MLQRDSKAQCAQSLAGWGAICLCLFGCEPESLVFTEVKRVHERLTPSEWSSLVRILDNLPDRQLPPFPQRIFPPPPQWSSSRSLPVSELYDEELRRREDCWDPAHLALYFDRQKTLLRELAREKMTKEQFAGLVLTVCAATCRRDLPADIDLQALIDRARPILEDLAGNKSAFPTLPPESQHTVVQQAMWISRLVRAETLQQVPPENILLVTRHREWIDRALPEEFRTNPPDEIRDTQEELGLPFEELPESGFDEDLRWPLASQPGPGQ